MQDHSLWGFDKSFFFFFEHNNNAVIRTWLLSSESQSYQFVFLEMPRERKPWGKLPHPGQPCVFQPAGSPGRVKKCQGKSRPQVSGEDRAPVGRARWVGWDFSERVLPLHFLDAQKRMSLWQRFDLSIRPLPVGREPFDDNKNPAFASLWLWRLHQDPPLCAKFPNHIIPPVQEVLG